LISLFIERTLIPMKARGFSVLSSGPGNPFASAMLLAAAPAALAVLACPNRLAFGADAKGAGDAASDASIFRRQRELAGEAQALKKRGELPAALRKIGEAVNLLPSAIEPQIVRAGILMEMERFKEALDGWSAVKTKMEPGSPLVYMLNLYSGECRLRLGDRAGARADLLEAKRLAPDTADAEKMKQVGTLLRITLLPLDALWLTRTTEDGRDVYSIWELHADGKCVVHTQPFRKPGNYTIDAPTGQAWPKDERAQIGLAVFQNGRWRMTFTKPQNQTMEGTYEIGADLKTLVVTQDGVKGPVTRERIAWWETQQTGDITRRANVLAREAMGLKERGDLAAALTKATSAVELLPTALEPRIVRAAIHIDLKRYEDALGDFSFLKALTPPGDANAYRAHLFSGRCRLELGDLPGAKKEALEAKRLALKSIDPKEAKMIEELLTEADSLVVRDGNVTGTVAAFRAREAAVVAEAEALFEKGQLLSALGKINEAFALVTFSDRPRVVRAHILMGLKRYQDALADWSQLIKDAEPDDEELYFLYFKRGDCRRLVGDRAGARADALEAKRLAPKSVTSKEREEFGKLLTLSNPLPLGACWTRVKTEDDREVFSVWELFADGRCAVHSLPVRKDGKYRLGGPFGQPWPGATRTSFGKATFQNGRWRMVFTKPPGKIAQGTYKLSADQKTFFGTEEGIDGSFTRTWAPMGVDDVLPQPDPAISNTNALPIPPKPATGLESAAASGKPLDYFALGFVLSALGEYSFYQKAPSEKESRTNRTLLEHLRLGSEVLARFDALDKLTHANRLPSGKYSDWPARTQRLWDGELQMAAMALREKSASAVSNLPEGNFFYILGTETYTLAIGLPKDVRDLGLRNPTTIDHLRDGLKGFVWLRDNVSASLSPGVAASVKTLAGYMGRMDDLGEAPMPQADMEKIVAAAGTIIEAAKGGKLMR